MLRQREEGYKLYENPMEMPDYVEADVQALRACNDGRATPDQQQRIIRWIINTGCCTYDASFRRGGVEAERDSIYAEGRRWVGLMLVHMLKYAPTQTSMDKIAVRIFGEKKGEQADDR